jgi:hypothetical protein
MTSQSKSEFDALKRQLLTSAPPDPHERVQFLALELRGLLTGRLGRSPAFADSLLNDILVGQNSLDQNSLLAALAFYTTMVEETDELGPRPRT